MVKCSQQINGNSANSRSKEIMKKFMRMVSFVFSVLMAFKVAIAVGLGPQNYVQDGLVTQFDAIDNEGTGTHNPSATIWQDLKGEASITLLSGACWMGRYFDSTYNKSHAINGMPHYVRDSLTLETALRVVEFSGSYPRDIGDHDRVSFYHQQGHIYWYIGTNPSRPHAGGFGDMGTLTGYSANNDHGIAFNGLVADKINSKVSGWLPTEESWYEHTWYLNGNSSGTMHGHYYAIRLYNRPLSSAEMMTNAVIDKLRFWSFRHESNDLNPKTWASIVWDVPELVAASQPTALTNDFVQIVGSQITVTTEDIIALKGLSLEDDATLELPAGSRSLVKVLYVNGQPIKRGLYSADGIGGVRVGWLKGAGVLAVAGDVDGAFPSGTYVGPDEDGYYVFGRRSSDNPAGATGFGKGWTPNPNTDFLWLSAECPEWGNYWFPECSKLKLVGYVLLKTIPSGVFSEIDISEAEHIVMYNKTATADGSEFVIPAGVELRYQPAGFWDYRNGKWWMPTARTSDTAEEGPLVIDGTLRVYGNGTHLSSQTFNGSISGSGKIQLGDFNNAVRFSGPFSFKGSATGFNNATLIWVDSLDVDASLGDVTLNGGGNYGTQPRYNANGIFFGRDGSGETANGELSIGTLRGEARSMIADNTRWRTGGALAIWGGNTIRVDLLRSALHVVGQPQDLGCTWGWFGTAKAIGNGNLSIKDADFIGSVFLSTNVNVTVGNVRDRVTFDYTYHAGTVNATTLDITNSCVSRAVVTATDIAMLPARISGFSGSVNLTDTTDKTFTIPIDFSKGTNVLYNTVGCIGSGTLVSAPASGTLNVTFDISKEQTIVEGKYSVVRFASGGELLNGWSVSLNGSICQSVSIGKYDVRLRRDSTGIWLKVAESKGLVVSVR